MSEVFTVLFALSMTGLAVQTGRYLAAKRTLRALEATDHE